MAPTGIGHWPCTLIRFARLTGPGVVGRLSSSSSHQIRLASSATSKQTRAAAHGPGGQTLERSSIDERIPAGAWDSHMHIVDPRFPLAKGTPHKPEYHTFADWQRFAKTLSARGSPRPRPERGLRRRHLRPRGHAFLRAAGVGQAGGPGVRINLKSDGVVLTQAELAATLQTYADAIRPLRWVVQIYMDMAAIPLLEPLVPGLGVPICIDHMGHPPLADLPAYAKTQDPATIPGFDAMARLLKAGHTYVKLSGAYRMATNPDGVTDVLPLARELLRTAERRVVFATDWPHTRYYGVDVRPWVGACLDLCDGDQVRIDRLFKSNAEELWAGVH
ncbi:4-sulfomuconolactone hydrolase [Apiospora arundinis]